VSIFGDRVRDLRHASRLKQADFQPHGISQSQLSLIENGETEPGPERIELISRVLERTPAELVAGTELERQYATARVTRAGGAAGEAANAFERSERIVAVEEAYKRVVRFVDLLLDPSANYRGDAENERYYQFGARILRRALDAAQTCDPALAGRVYIPDSIMDASVAKGALQFTMTKSLVYIQSLLLEFPEADNSATRSAVIARIGLAAVDDHLASSRPARLVAR
jgi:transcriptional regulator with XRE-family HTH domain